MLAGGLRNRLYSCYVDTVLFSHEALVVRVNTDVTSAFGVNRSTELRYTWMIMQNDIGIHTLYHLNDSYDPLMFGII